jgi:hypothetical protein
MTITTHPPKTLLTTAPSGRWIGRAAALALAGALAIGGAVLITNGQPAPAVQTELRDGWQVNVPANANTAQATALRDGWQVAIPTNSSGAISSNDCAFWC